MTATIDPNLNLDDLDWWTKPAAERDAVFAHFRAHDPRPFFPEIDMDGNRRGRGFYSLTKYDDVVEVSRRPKEFINGEGVNIYDQSPSLRDFLGSFIAMDDPEHARLRRIVGRGFTAKNMELLHDKVVETTRELLSEISERGECDFVADFAALLPIRIVNDMLGIPREYEKLVFDCTNIVLGASDPEYCPDQSGRGIAKALDKAARTLADLLDEQGRDRLQNPKDDLITQLVSAGNEENLTPTELASFFILLVGAGNETTRNALAHGLVALTQFPDQRALWEADPHEITPTAVEEIIRWSSPVHYMRRTVSGDDVWLGDQKFEDGDKVVMWYRSANRDEAVFERPDDFIVTRDPNPHIGFGAPGPHHCLGSHLARLEIGIVYETIFELLPDLHATGEPDYLRSNFLHGVKHLPAAFTPKKL